MQAFVIKDKENNYLTDTSNWTEKICNAYINNDKNHLERLKELELLTDCEVVEITIVEGNLDTYIDKLQDERDFERRDKTYIVKQLNDPNDYVIREDYIKLEERLEKEMDLIGELDCYFEDIFTELDRNWKVDKKWQGGMKGWYEEAIREIKELKEQLAEKDKEIENLKENNRITHALYKNIYTQLQNYKNQLYEIDVKKLMSKKLTLEQKEIYYKGFANCEGQISSHIADVTIRIRKQVCDEIFKELQENTDCYFEERKCNSPHSQLPYIWFNEIRFRKFLDQIEKGDIDEN